jgi:hypothetical protein
MKKIMFFCFCFFASTCFASKYPNWEMKYPAYKKLFTENSQLEEKVSLIRDKYRSHIHAKRKNYTNHDSEKSEFYSALLDDLNDTTKSTNILGQSLIFAYEANLDAQLKQYHFSVLCQNLKIYLPNSTFEYKSPIFIEWGKKFVGSDDLKLITDASNLNHSISKEVNSICKRITLDTKFFN